MPFSQDLKVLPLSLARFVKAYDVTCDLEDTIQAYGIYLDTNENQHHYHEGVNKREWFVHEILNYVKGEHNEIS